MPEIEAADWFVEPFFADGTVNWPLARQWVGDMHLTLRQHLGAKAWTDEHARWLGRLSHDALSFQGVMLTQATPDDLDDLLFTLLPATKQALPGSPAAAVRALRAVYIYGTQEVGAVQASDALAWLESDTREQALSRALAGLVSKAKQTGRRMPRRKKNNRRRRKH